MEPDDADEIINEQAQVDASGFVSKVTISDDRIEVTHGGISAVVTSPTGIRQINAMLAQQVLQTVLNGQEHWKYCDQTLDGSSELGVASLGGNNCLRHREMAKVRAMSAAEKAAFGVFTRA